MLQTILLNINEKKHEKVVNLVKLQVHSYYLTLLVVAYSTAITDRHCESVKVTNNRSFPEILATNGRR